jgi:tRNA(fMet)-specific endonuclease VapC
VGALIDTSVFIAAERGRFDLAAWLRLHLDEAFSIGAITASELLHGVHRAPMGRRREARQRFVREILETYPIHPFDGAVAEIHARIWADLVGRGRTIGAHDLLLAATALAAGLDVVTLNEREFGRVAGLTVRNPLAPP